MDRGREYLRAGFGAHIGDNDDIFFTNRFNNSARYVSPTFSGFTFAGGDAFSTSTQFSNNNGFSGSGVYANGPLKAGVAFTQFNRRSNATPSNRTSGAVDSTGWGFCSPFVVSPTGASADQQRILGTGVTYDFGFVNVLASYSNVLFNYSDTTGLCLQNGKLGVWKRFTPAFHVGVLHVHTAGEYSGDRSPHTLLRNEAKASPLMDSQ